MAVRPCRLRSSQYNRSPIGIKGGRHFTSRIAGNPPFSRGFSHFSACRPSGPSCRFSSPTNRPGSRIALKLLVSRLARFLLISRRKSDCFSAAVGLARGLSATTPTTFARTPRKPAKRPKKRFGQRQTRQYLARPKRLGRSAEAGRPAPKKQAAVGSASLHNLLFGQYTFLRKQAAFRPVENSLLDAVAGFRQQCRKHGWRGQSPRPSSQKSGETAGRPRAAAPPGFRWPEKSE